MNKEFGEIHETGVGRYLYCIINSGEDYCFEDIGLDDNIVYTIPHQDISAVVHSCMAKPYETKDNEKAKEWIFGHNYVIDKATGKFGSVIPFSFDAIVRGNDDTVKKWLSGNHLKIKEELSRVKNKAEYSVQVFCRHEVLKEIFINSNRELNELEEKVKIMSKGTAYLFQRKFELQVKDVISSGVSRLASEFCAVIKESVEEMKIEERTTQIPDIYKDWKLIMKVSCLVRNDKVGKLGDTLDEINNRDGFAVRFTGPWAPFNFVKLKEV